MQSRELEWKIQLCQEELDILKAARKIRQQHINFTELEKYIHQHEVQLDGLKAARELHLQNVDFLNEVLAECLLRQSIQKKLAHGPMRAHDLKLFLYAQWCELQSPILIDSVITEMLRDGKIVKQCIGRSSVISLPSDE